MLHHHVNRHSRLWLVGIDTDTELYSFSLKVLLDAFHLKDAVNFVGCLADSEVKALYQSCTAYLCMSEHEGFCLPIIEAMNFGLPVVAFASSAVPDTLGTGGVLFRQKRHAEIAELINEIHLNSELRSRLSKAGVERVAELSFEEFERRVEALFTSPAMSLSGSYA